MGYYCDQVTCEFFIAASNVPAALAAIKQMAVSEHERGGGSSSQMVDGKLNITRHYSWVSPSYVQSRTFKEAMNEWRWDVEEDAQGNILSVLFKGEKLGDDAELMSAIAPFVEHRSYIQMRGEDDSVWRWVFWRGELREESPIIIWAYESMTPAQELLEAAAEQTA